MTRTKSATNPIEYEESNGNIFTAILNVQRVMTADTALWLAHYFSTSAELWLNLQSAYDLRRTRQAGGKQIERDIVPHAA